MRKIAQWNGKEETFIFDKLYFTKGGRKYEVPTDSVVEQVGGTKAKMLRVKVLAPSHMKDIVKYLV